MPSITLHIFTNCCKQSPYHKLLQTYESFCSKFGKIEPVIWIDPNPCPGKFDDYVLKLSRHFKDLHHGKSLSHNYTKAIVNSQSDYCMMLEHDWTFTKYVKHSLPEIITAMHDMGVYHLRFNKRANILHQSTDRTLKECKSDGIEFCITPFLSNNPHIIHRETYLKFIRRGYIQIRPKSHGIEEVISRFPDTFGAIYSGLGYPACVKHLDARGHYKKKGVKII